MGRVASQLPPDVWIPLQSLSIAVPRFQSDLPARRKQRDLKSVDRNSFSDNSDDGVLLVSRDEVGIEIGQSCGIRHCEEDVVSRGKSAQLKFAVGATIDQ